MTAGAPPAAVTIQRIEDELGWSIIQIYGLTETAPAISICEPRPEHQSLSKEDRARIKARQGVELITSGELRVVDDQGREVPADGKTPGEIIARGNVIMQGYYNDPEATEKCMGDGWFHTGDAAVVHPDGYVQITDRLKDVIISGGENISSVEVEAMLLRHDAIQEVAVVGVPHEKWGEAPHAFVVFKSRPVGDAGGAARVLPREHGALQGAARVHAGRGVAEDGDREDSEVRVAKGPRQHQRAVSARRAAPTRARRRSP